MLNIDQVVDLYTKENIGIHELRRRFHVRSTVIHDLLVSAGVQLRSWSDARLRNRISTDEIVRLYAEEKLSPDAIGVKLGINPKTVRLRLKKSGAQIRTGSEAALLRPRIKRGSYTIPTEAFWFKVNKEGPVPAHRPELGPCWLWTGAHHKDGRGLFSYVDEKGKRINLTARGLHIKKSTALSLNQNPTLATSATTPRVSDQHTCFQGHLRITRAMQPQKAAWQQVNETVGLYSHKSKRAKSEDCMPQGNTVNKV
jgi:hypothetical protein